MIKGLYCARGRSLTFEPGRDTAAAPGPGRRFTHILLGLGLILVKTGMQCIQ